MDKIAPFSDLAASGDDDLVFDDVEIAAAPLIPAASADLAATGDDDLIFDDPEIAVQPATPASAQLATTGDDDLVFDDPEIAAQPAIPIIPTPAPASSRRSPRRSRDAVAAQASAIPGPDPLPASAPAKPPVTEEPADAPTPVPQRDGSAGFDRRMAMLFAIVVFALLTSLVSVGGLIAVGRTLAVTQANRARAQEESEAIARMPAIIKALDDASTRLAISASHAPSGEPPATAADVHQALDQLRVALAAHQPDGLAPLNGTMHDGFSEMGTRLDRLSRAMEGQSRGVNASRPAPRAAYQGQPS